MAAVSTAAVGTLGTSTESDVKASAAWGAAVGAAGGVTAAVCVARGVARASVGAGLAVGLAATGTAVAGCVVGTGWAAGVAARAQAASRSIRHRRTSREQVKGRVYCMALPPCEYQQSVTSAGTFEGCSISRNLVKNRAIPGASQPARLLNRVAAAPYNGAESSYASNDMPAPPSSLGTNSHQKPARPAYRAVPPARSCLVPGGPRRCPSPGERWPVPRLCGGRGEETARRTGS